MIGCDNDDCPFQWVSIIPLLHPNYKIYVISVPPGLCGFEATLT